MIIIGGILLMLLIMGTVIFGWWLTDKINDIFKVNLDYYLTVLPLLMIELLILTQILYNKGILT